MDVPARCVAVYIVQTSAGGNRGNAGNAEGNRGNAGNAEGNPGNDGNAEGNPGNDGNAEGNRGNAGNAQGNRGNVGNAKGNRGNEMRGTVSDTTDDEAEAASYPGEVGSEIEESSEETRESRAAQHWINQEGWDAAGEGRATSPTSGREIDLRLDWDDVKRKLAKGAGTDIDASPSRVNERVEVEVAGTPTEALPASMLLEGYS